MITSDEAERLVGAHLDATNRAPCLIAVDGLPLSGKSTLAMRLVKRFELRLLPFDSFVAPRPVWQDRAPTFPFPHFRDDAFVEALHALRSYGACTYQPIVWETLQVSHVARRLVFDRPIVVEGVSVGRADLASLYALRFWVASDGETMFEAMLDRDGDGLRDDWRDLFLPSVEMYLNTTPQLLAHHVVAGRGA
jgi:uridine kinase